MQTLDQLLYVRSLIIVDQEANILMSFKFVSIKIGKLWLKHSINLDCTKDIDTFLLLDRVQYFLAHFLEHHFFDIYIFYT